MARTKWAPPTNSVMQAPLAQALAQANPASSTQRSTVPPLILPAAWTPSLWDAMKRSVMECMGLFLGGRGAAWCPIMAGYRKRTLFILK